jgi:hypothetical protein
MKFTCDQCGKTFSFRNNLYRHKKNTCKNHIIPHLNPVTPHLNPVTPHLNPVTPHLNSVTPHLNPVTPHLNSVTPHLNSVTPHLNPDILINKNFEKINKFIVKCLNCSKQLTKSNFSRHLKSCKGCPTNICRYCNQFFKNNANISRHEKKCNKQEIYTPIENITPGYMQYPTVLNQNITINNNIINNNIVLNLFGVESWDYLIKICEGENKTEFEKLKMQLLTEGVDGLCKLIECHYFNKDYPQNQTIRKNIKNNDFVEVHVGNNEWEPKTLDTAMEEIKHTTSMYIRPFVDDVIQTNYHINQHIRDKLNNTFVDLLVPLQYDMCGEYYQRLSGVEEPIKHIVKQKEQISKRKIKAMLFEYSSKLIKLSDRII